MFTLSLSVARFRSSFVVLVQQCICFHADMFYFCSHLQNFKCNFTNIYAPQFQVISVIEKRADQLDYVLVDTPGQIEIFTWSASGAIITEAFASTFPTVVAYVVDTPRAENPTTFMSNMLYACSILYKTRLPLILAFNKVDVAQHEFALEVLLILMNFL